MENSDEVIRCAGQRPDQVGSSPTGARIRGAISKSGGNASLAGACINMATVLRGHEVGNDGSTWEDGPKLMHCIPNTGGQGVRREAESEGLAEQYRAVVKGVKPRANRSAKDGARSSWPYDGEGVLIHPSYQGVCERHGTEDLDVTPGGLVMFPGGAGITDPISRKAKWKGMRGESSDNCKVPQAWRKPCDRNSGDRVGRGRRLAIVVGANRSDVRTIRRTSSMSEDPDIIDRGDCRTGSIQRVRGRSTLWWTRCTSGRIWRWPGRR